MLIITSLPKMNSLKMTDEAEDLASEIEEGPEE